MSAIDLHQHLWPEELVDLLRSRTRRPYLRGWTLHTTGEPAYDVAPADHDVDARVALDHHAEVGLACLSLSAPLGLEQLPRHEAVAALDAWHLGAAALPAHFVAWASVPEVEPDLVELAGLLTHPGHRFVGVQLPATALAGPAGWESLAPVLEVAQAADKPVLVHPGPARPVAGGGAPGWWAPVVDYTAQLQAAWWGWHAFRGREQLPGLRVVFAAGAGLAPLQHERLAARGGGSGRVDPNLFVDTSSYGTQAIDGLVRALGLDVLVLGSDRPYAEPLRAVLGEAATHLIRVDNPRRALGSRHVAHLGGLDRVEDVA